MSTPVANPPRVRLLTPPGKGGIAVIAMTGPAAREWLGSIFTPHRPGDARPGQLQLGMLTDSEGAPIDEAVVAITGDTVEINIHGGPVVTHAALKRLAELGAMLLDRDDPADASFRWTHPKWNNRAIGEELFAVLPTLQSPAALKTFSQQWSAGLSKLTFTEPVTSTALRQAAGRLATMHALLHPPRVVLAGAPNTGKSTLANVLTGREVSIVNAMTGTTRDWVASLAILRGVGIHLTDTAGIFDVAIADDPHGINAESVARARARAMQAQLVVLLEPGRRPEVPAWLAGRNVLCIASQCDSAGHDASADACVSGATGEGVDDLMDAILAAVGLADINPATPAAFTPRQAKLLIAGADALDAGDRPLARALLDELLVG